VTVSGIAREVRLQPLNGRGDDDAGGPAGRGAAAGNIRPQQEMEIVMTDPGRPQGLEKAEGTDAIG
jgi:hypothetical protein